MLVKLINTIILQKVISYINIYSFTPLLYEHKLYYLEDGKFLRLSLTYIYFVSIKHTYDSKSHNMKRQPQIFKTRKGQPQFDIFFQYAIIK